VKTLYHKELIWPFFCLDLKEQFTQLYRFNQQKPNLCLTSPGNKTENQRKPNLRLISRVNKTENQRRPNLRPISPVNKTENQRKPNLRPIPPVNKTENQKSLICVLLFRVIRQKTSKPQFLSDYLIIRRRK